jgi:hypothetical protein
MKIQYKKGRLESKTSVLIEEANLIIEAWMENGFDLTLRQLHYQLVSRGKYENTQQNYNKLKYALVRARMMGIVDWAAIVDRTRSLRSIKHYDSAEDRFGLIHDGYAENLWDQQVNYVEVWIEKDALVGTIRKTCNAYDVPYFSCRGNSSTTALHEALERLMLKEQDGYQPVIIFLSDHDPTGLDMERDLLRS